MTAKSDRVKRLLEDDDLKEAFENVKRFLMEEFFRTDSEDVDRLQDISKRANLLEAVKADLYAAIEAGDYEDFLAQKEEDMSYGRHGSH